MPIFFKVTTRAEGGNYYIATLDEAKQTLDYMADEKCYSPIDQQEYCFEAVEMSQEEYDKLPVFDGF